MTTEDNKILIEPTQMNPEFDVSLIEYNLTLTPEKRLENHDQALSLFHELLKARKQLDAKS